MSTNENATRRLSLDEIRQILLPYGGSALTDSQLASLDKYLGLLKKWNQTIPLTSIEDDSEIVSRHFGESIFPGSLVPMSRGRLADVGSGAGFPGMALKIFSPDLEVHLIEQNAKKATFLRETSRFLNFEGIFVSGRDYRQLPGEMGAFDWVTAKAFGSYMELLDWAHSRLSSAGTVALWLGSDDSARFSAVPRWRWAPPITIPDSKRRILFSGTAI